jgi:hypothetical protein
MISLSNYLRNIVAIISSPVDIHNYLYHCTNIEPVRGYLKLDPKLCEAPGCPKNCPKTCPEDEVIDDDIIVSPKCEHSQKLIYFSKYVESDYGDYVYGIPKNTAGLELSPMSGDHFTLNYPIKAKYFGYAFDFIEKHPEMKGKG